MMMMMMTIRTIIIIIIITMTWVGHVVRMWEMKFCIQSYCEISRE